MKKLIILIISIIALQSCGTTQLLQNSVYDLQNRVTKLEVLTNKQQETLDEQEQIIAEQQQLINELQIKNNKEVNSYKTEYNTESIKEKTNSYNTTKTTGSNRCQAITKAGTQCKRTAVAGSKYCWQHQK